MNKIPLKRLAESTTFDSVCTYIEDAEEIGSDSLTTRKEVRLIIKNLMKAYDLVNLEAGTAMLGRIKNFIKSEIDKANFTDVYKAQFKRSVDNEESVYDLMLLLQHIAATTRF
jgi:predicted XRE-type DNA-binding protein